MDKNYCLFTNDVETTSIINHCLRDETVDYILNQGMPRLLYLYEKYNVRATFFYTGYIARLKPHVVKMAHERGHEIASHGLTHEVNMAFDILPIETQIEHLKQSKAILEDIIGEEVISFRAPAGRVNYNIPIALEEAGYKIDSSVSSQRIDMFFSFGSLKKLNWLTSPRLPYFVTLENVFKKGNSSILEIPISAFGFPYIGTFMRISPRLNRVIRKLLYFETLLNGRPFNFLTHPNEFIDEDRGVNLIERRGSNLISYYLGDILRYKLKIINLGAKAIPIFEHEIDFFHRKNFSFVTCQQYYVLKTNDHARK